MEVRTSLDCPTCNPKHWVDDVAKWEEAKKKFNVKCGNCKEIYPITGEPSKAQQFDAEHPFA